MDSEELLAQLADIHLPEPISYWPPAIGWWILAAILLFLLVILIRRFADYRRQQKICQYAQAELNRCYATFSAADATNQGHSRLQYVNQFNSVLRRVALVHYPQGNVASLDGSAWVDFIREKGESALLSDEIAAALEYGRFQTSCEVDVDAMQDFGLHWIESLYKSNKPDRPASNPQGLRADA